MRVLNRQIWPYVLAVPVPLFSPSQWEIDLWCVEVFGARHQRWYAYNLRKDTRTYAFKNEADLLVFKLRTLNV